MKHYAECAVPSLSLVVIMFFKMLKIIRHMGELCCLGTGLSL